MDLSGEQIFGIATAFVGLIIGMVKFLISRALAQYDAKLKELDAAFNEVRAIKADLPLNYIRREDFMRNEVVVNAKLDKLWERMDKAGFISKDDFIRHEAGVNARLDGLMRQIDALREKLK